MILSMRPQGRLLLLTFIAVPAFATPPTKCGSDAQSAISTDRPQVTAASTVVPCGSLQFENGFSITANGHQYTFDVPETSLRFGVRGKGEFRFTVPNYFSNDDTSSGFTSGFGDIVLGYKQQLGPLRGFDLSVIPSLSLPTGSSEISSGGYDPSLLLPWSHSLSKNWTIAGMFSGMWPTQPTGRITTGQASFYFDRQIMAPLDAWIEYSGSFPERGSPANLINFGASYKPTPHQQIDFHWIAGLSAATPDYQVGLGYSVRFQIVRTR